VVESVCGLHHHVVPPCVMTGCTSCQLLCILVVLVGLLCIVVGSSVESQASHDLGDFGAGAPVQVVGCTDDYS